MKFIDKIAKDEFAPGIPEKGRKSSLPAGEDQKWDVNIQDHRAKKAGRHTDLRLSPPSSQTAYSWALPTGMPGPGNKSLALRQSDHTAQYMGFEGEIEEGYGAGKVTSKFLGKAHILEAKPDKILFNIYEGSDVTRYMLKQLQDDEWLLYNYSHTIEKEDIPTYKPKTDKIDFDKLRTDFDNEIFTPKLDGAHTTTHLRPGKIIDTYSYRTSKKSPKRIDHTFRTNLYKRRAPEELGDTILRTELYLPGERGNEVARVLNSNVWKARKMQQEGKSLRPALIDIVRFKGQDVENAPYKDKLNMLKQVSDMIPELDLPPMYTTQKEKEDLKKKLKRGEHDLTEEGVMVYKLNEPAPYKSKKKEDFDVLITGIYPARQGTKYEGSHIGGFVGRIEGEDGTKIRVGTGLTDDIRRDAYLNPEDYIGQWAKVEAQHRHPSGKLQAPSFKGLRSDKYPNKRLQSEAQNKSTSELLKLAKKRVREVYESSYEGAPNDPSPKVLILGDYKHPNTGNKLTGAINLNYLKPEDRKKIRQIADKYMRGKNLKERYDEVANLQSDAARKAYRTYLKNKLNLEKRAGIGVALLQMEPEEREKKLKEIMNH